MAGKRSKSPMADALKALARRPQTESELRDRLAVHEWAASEIDEVLAQLREDGHVDDAKLALEYMILRSARLAIGPLKLIVALRKRGVSEGVAQSAWRKALDAGDVDPLRALRCRMQRHVTSATGALDLKSYARVYNALLRAGFEGEQVRSELEPYRAPAASHDSSDLDFPPASEASHDVP